MGAADPADFVLVNDTGAVAGIAAADAVSMALCLLALLYISKLAGRYVADVKPRSSVRASDFTVLVRGLPDVTPADVSDPEVGRPPAKSLWTICYGPEPDAWGL
jgi:hypothetical protein